MITPSRDRSAISRCDIGYFLPVQMISRQGPVAWHQESTKAALKVGSKRRRHQPAHIFGLRKKGCSDNFCPGGEPAFSALLANEKQIPFNIAALDPEEAAPLADDKYFTQRISSVVSLVRDRFVVDLLARRLAVDRRVLIVFGGSHYFTQRKALETLLGKPALHPLSGTFVLFLSRGERLKPRARKDQGGSSWQRKNRQSRKKVLL